MARNKKRRKKKPVQSLVKIKPETYIRKHARKLPIYECLIREDWREAMFSPVVVARQKKNGDLLVCTYIVDMQCLGVKDVSYITGIDIDNYKANIDKLEGGMFLTFEKIDPNLCFNIIYGAVEFAEDSGFSPHKDFDIAEYILEDVSKIEYVEIPFGGEDGQPLFVAGPYDDSEKILATLRKTKGEANFHSISAISPDNFDIEDVESKQRIIKEYFPQHTIDQKLQSFKTEETKAVWGLQLNTATTILIAGRGDIDLIKKLNEEGEDFLEDIMEKVLIDLEEGMEEGQEIYVYGEEYNILREQVQWVLDKVIEHNGPHFLWEEDYFPGGDFPSDIDLDQLTPEEWAALEKKKMYHMTNEKRDEYLFSRIFLKQAEDYELEDMLVKENQEKIMNNYLEQLKTEVFKDRWNEEAEEYSRWVANDVLEHIKKKVAEKS